MRYKLLVDYGKPMEEYYGSEHALKGRLKELYKKSDDYPHMDVFVIDNHTGQDITDSHNIQAMFEEIIQEKGDNEE